MSEKLISIGKIVAPHGVRGDVRVLPLTDFPDRFEKLAKVRLDDGRCFSVTGMKYHKKFILLKFRGIESMNDAEPLRGKLIQVTTDELVVLPEGHYYHFQIIGLRVYNEAAEYLGDVTDILETGSNDVYVAEQKGQRPILIPALKKVVREIDIPGGKMIVRLPEWETE
ncbi:hypothetical protein P22_1698 [Propionispora sp. 2/2-37]|uniref:ribosome maturation factor RimM n=1 Tax=Propionispora sp. 2/2-37 TaxID=1677858 RepID=UPI0006BB75BB|nr:ribosome maturation factor RimM [Propionispora sp. 2/2-37]CUH95624.1 hypothetical protein P22_1698 [Propionispora sp. 2/2-37]